MISKVCSSLSKRTSQVFGTSTFSLLRCRPFVVSRMSVMSSSACGHTSESFDTHTLTTSVFENMSAAFGSTVNNFTPLMVASMQGHVASVRQLLLAGAKQTIFQSRTPLAYACTFGHSEVARVLLEEDSIVHLNARYSDGSTPLTLAVRCQYEDVIHVLMAQPSLDVDSRNNDGYTALYFASYNGHASAVLMLLKAGANPELTSLEGISPLMAASNRGHSKVVNILQCKAQVNATDSNGCTALHRAAYNGFGDVTRALLEHPSLDVNAQDKDGFTPLVMAASMGHLEVVSALLAHCSVNVNAQNEKTGATALHYAAERGNDYVVRALVAHPSLDAAVQCKDGRTALGAAAKQGHVLIEEILLEAGAKIAIP